MAYRLSNIFPKKRAFITGSASGLGKALMLELAADGWTIGAADINVKTLEAAAEEGRQAGGTLLPYPLDVSDEDAYKEVAERFVHDAGGIDLLINNAGVADGNYLQDFPIEHWNWIVGINQMGVVNGCYHFLKHFQQQQNGHIINIASAAAFACAPRMAAYNTTKAAVLALSETLHAELKPQGIKVSVAMPLFFRSKLMESVRGEDARYMTKLMVEGADEDAANIARRILTVAGKGKLYIHTSARSYWLHWFKRRFPMLLQNIKARAAAKPERFRERAEKKYRKKYGPA